VGRARGEVADSGLIWGRVLDDLSVEVATT